MPKVVNTQLSSSPLASAAQPIPTDAALKQNPPSDSFGVAPINPTARGEGLSKLGQGITNFANTLQAMQSRINTTAAEEQLVKFEREKNNLFFNTDNGYFNTSGRDAYDRATPFTESLEKLQNAHADQLSNIESRNMFVRASDSQITKAKSDVMRHSSAQFDAWERATLNSRVESTLENAALFWKDPDQLSISLELGRQSVMDLGQVTGASAETVAADLRSFNSKFAVNTIEGALSQSASAAQTMLADTKELLEGPDIVNLQNKIDQQLKVEKNQNDSQSAVVMGTSLVLEHSEKSDARNLIIADVNQIEDPALRQKTMRESMYQFDQLRRAKNERRGESFESAENFIVQGGSVEQFIAENPAAWDDLTSAQKSKIVSGTAVETNFAKLSELLLLPMDKLAKVDPALHFHELSPSDRRRLISAVDSARKGDGAAQIGRTKASQVTTTVENFFGKRSTWNNKDRTGADAFYAALTAEEGFRVKQLNRELNSEEFTALLNDMSREISINRSIFPGVTTLDITDIPAEDLGPLTEILHRNNIPATSDNLLKAYEQARK